jgi:hypothetical protein
VKCASDSFGGGGRGPAFSLDEYCRLLPSMAMDGWNSVAVSAGERQAVEALRLEWACSCLELISELGTDVTVRTGLWWRSMY